MNKTTWTKEEVAIIRANSNLPLRKLAPLIPNHTYKAVGVFRKLRIDNWTEPEDTSDQCFDKIAPEVYEPKQMDWTQWKPTYKIAPIAEETKLAVRLQQMLRGIV